MNSSLQMWKDISPYPTPLKTPTASSPQILVVGGGVIGLTTAWVLLDRGFHVSIVAKKWVSFAKDQRLTSQIAGALWEFPPAVCGKHTDTISLQNSKRWCMVAYKIWETIAADPDVDAGVKMKMADFFFPGKVEDDPEHYSKMLDIMASGVRGFKHSPDIIKERGINPDYGAVDAYEHLAPVIDTDHAMKWLTGLVEAKGAVRFTEAIHGDLLYCEQELRARFRADAIVNATGLAGAELAGDSTCYPIRGGLLRVINDGTDFPKIDTALAITADVSHNSSEMVFLVPRNDNILLMGGITEPHQWNLDLQLDSPMIKRMRARCESFLPCLKNARLDPDYPLAQGLRPFRGQNVRVERELRPRGRYMAPSRIVHSYGHGGAGWSLSFGCAAEVVILVEQALIDIPPKGMDSSDEVLAVDIKSLKRSSQNHFEPSVIRARL